MNSKQVWIPALLAVLLSVGLNAWAAEAPIAPGAQAAALASEADTLEADIDKQCQKVAREARRLCRAQQLQAVQRLRARAARLR